MGHDPGTAAAEEAGGRTDPPRKFTGYQVTQAAVGWLQIVLQTPVFQDLLCLLTIDEAVSVQTLLPQTTIEALDIRVFPRTAVT